ncbi:MAG: FecR domain-containing protein [Saprospirales bacterium]|nr:FecR domain-containing protein [Saprospirales bacterium]
MNDQERILLLHKRWTGSISPAELARLEEWLASDEAFRKEARSLESIWEKAAKTQSSFQPDTARAWDRFQKEMHATPAAPARIIRIPRVWRVAASLLLLVGAMAAATLFLPGVRSQLQQAFYGGNTFQTYTLSDGSEVMVNAYSQFKFPDTFEEGERRVYLEGEAFFKVKSNPAHPFIVQTPRGQVRVTGTKFNVRAYAKEDFEEVFLQSGRVMYQAGQELDAVKLNPKERVVLEKSAQALQTYSDPDAIPLYWVEGRLNFRNTRFEEILPVMEQYFHVKFDVENVRPYLHCRHTFNLSGLSLRESLDLIKAVANIEYMEIGPKAYRLNGGRGAIPCK